MSSFGVIDWMCVPRFDGHPIFGRLIDPDGGGSYAVSFDGTREIARRYSPGSAVLETSVATETGTVRMRDGMIADISGASLPVNLLVRAIDCTAGKVSTQVLFDPRLGLPGRRPRRVRALRSLGGVVCEWGPLVVSLTSTPALPIEPGRPCSAGLQAGERLTLVMSVANGSLLSWPSAEAARSSLADSDRWWQLWSESIAYDGPYRSAVTRSLITLRLLTYSPSGAPVAAPTTSLPEAVGAGRNWDYRYAWPRDAAIGLVGFLSTGNGELAESFMHWLLHAGRLTRPRLRVLYDLYGKPAPEEREVEAAGYRASRPVRVGNGAAAQHQLDVYGWVVDAASMLDRSERGLHGETWRAVSGFADFVADNWARPDAGIWEVRGDPAQYVHSKLMAWLALDRVSGMARNRRTRTQRVARWTNERDAIATWIRRHGVDETRKTLVWKAGSDEVDASLLLLPVLGLEPEGSSLVSQTIRAIREDLEVKKGLLLRYPEQADGLDGEEGAFLPCSFWLIQALAKTGEVEEASEIFERILSYQNDVGLWAEEMDPLTKEQLGNYPQAFTHATLVQAALALRETAPARSGAS